MKYLATAFLAGLALAAPRPQDIDFDAVDALPDVVDIPADVITTVVAVPLATLTASIAADVATNPASQATAAATPVGEPNAPVSRRSLEARTAPCAAISPAGTNPGGLDVTSYTSFINDPIAINAANNAVTPSGYVNTFSASNAATKNSAFLLSTTSFTSYDVAACAKLCDNYKNDKCRGFNIYFSRDPVIATDAQQCPDSAATSFIRCVLYSTKVDVDTMKNKGQFRNKFQTGYAGSNGYTSGKTWVIPGYTGPQVLGDNAINAPLDCNGVDTYMGVKIVQQPEFDPTLCAAACDAQTKYNVAHPPKNGPARICHFFNVYIISVDDEPQGQYCALYTQYWDASYAVNKVQYRGDSKYTKSYSFTYYTTGNQGLPTCQNEAEEVRRALEGSQ